jgi:membrane protein YqaA with SNARE-associated domain
MEEQPAVAKKPNIVRRLYNWVLHWADTPYGTPALAAISFSESSFFPIPPDVLQIALSVAKPKRSYYYALVNAVCSVLGGVAGYFIGMFLWMETKDYFFTYIPGFTPAVFEVVEGKYRENAELAILAAAFTPIPFKVFTIAAGACNVPLLTLLWTSVVGRSARFFLVATTLYFFGPTAKSWLEKYFELITLTMFILLVGGFFVIKWLL